MGRTRSRFAPTTWARRLVLVGVLLSACGTADAEGVSTPASQGSTSATRVESPTRDPMLWPFASTSIWNMPIGSDAHLTPANLEASREIGNFQEEDIVVLAPNAPMTDVLTSNADWDPTRDRCLPEPERIVVDRVPIPPGFLTEPQLGSTDNNAAAILGSDGRTLHQSQPLVLCSSGAATSHYRAADTDLYGDGIIGSHGGSRLSALGGTIRLGELVPDGIIRHAMKIVMDPRYFHYDTTDPTPGYRWPASTADGYASVSYTGGNPALEMGSLLVLPADFNVESLHTEPARIIARAARDYGMYVVDSAGFDAYSLATEWSPNGRVASEFQRVWGMPYVQEDLTNPWSLDMATIVTHLSIVTNNRPEAPGGGGTPRVPMAPPLIDPALR